jgi:succinoglycan biosynthesis protein ExoA
MAKAIAHLLASPFGAGAPRYHRKVRQPTEVDTVWGGCYRRELFERIGLYDEKLAKGQDREFNQRLRDAGGKILLIPGVEVTYYTTRADLATFCRWMLLVGFTPFHAGRVAKRRVVSLRNFAPLAAGSAAVVLLTTSLYYHTSLLPLAFLAAYVAAAVASSAACAWRERDPRYLLILPVLYFLTHALYALGSAWGLLKPAGSGDTEAPPAA